jgi:hypothetical protein
MSETTGRRRMPDGLFVRDIEGEEAQGVPLAGLLFLLTRTSEMRHLTECLAAHLADFDELPTRGAVIPLWVDGADAWNCDEATQAAAYAKLNGCTVIALTVVPNEKGDQLIYEPLPASLAVGAIAAMHQLLRDEG